MLLVRFSGGFDKTSRRGYFQSLDSPPTIIKAIQAFSVISIKKGTCNKNQGGRAPPSPP